MLDRFPADLTLFYYPCPDELAHAVQVYVEPDAESNDPRRFATAWSMTGEVYERADRYLAAIAARLDEDDALVVSSDHGVAGVHTTVHVNTVLARRGLAAFRPDGRLDPSATRVFLPPANHGFLLQHQGKARDLDQAVRAMLGLRDPATGESGLRLCPPSVQRFRGGRGRALSCGHARVRAERASRSPAARALGHEGPPPVRR